MKSKRRANPPYTIELVRCPRTNVVTVEKH